MSERLRIDQALSRYGFCPRSHAAGWLKRGRVCVDGAPATDASLRVEPARLTVDGASIPFPDGMLIMLHKPVGHVCSHAADEGPSVYGLLPPQFLERSPRPEAVGRLDKDTSGLLLLTDQGKLIQQWTHPRHEVEKEYEATLDRPPPPECAALFAAGTLRLEGEERPCKPARLEPLDGPLRWRLTVTEGRYHLVRRMFAAVGSTVVALHRPRVGEYRLGDLPAGQFTALPLP